MKSFSPFFIKISLLSLLWLINFPSFGQQLPYLTTKTVKGKAKKIYARANECQKKRLWDKAIKDFETVLKLEPTFIDAHYQLASIYFNQKDFPKAISKLQKVLELDAVYKPQAAYYLGLAYWETDNFSAANQYFGQYLQHASDRSRLKARAEKYLVNSKFAMEAVKNAVPFHPKPLNSEVNTPSPEYLPSITADGNTLVFTRRIRGDEEVFMSEWRDSQWTIPKPILDINTPENEGSQYISADGNLIVFVRCSDRQGYGGCDLYFSEKKGNIWTKPENMGQPINTRGWESQPSLSADGNTLYFASSRKGSLGGRDIWRSNRNPDGTWSNPYNLGSNINTPEDDESPFFHPDGKTLYFMSKGHQGMGGYDLFFSKKEKNVWQKPSNLGYPINTKGNEGALFITLDGTTAYFTKDNLPDDDFEKLSSRKQPDIFTFELPSHLRPTPVTYLKAVVKDAVTTEKLEHSKVEVVDLYSNEVITTAKTNLSGSFLACLPMGSNYALNVYKEDYLFYSENVELVETTSLAEPFLLTINLQPIPKQTTTETVDKTEPVILKNVFFESGSAKLKNTSLTELNHLKKLLEDYTDLNIQINGHTDNVGTDNDNLKLSENRAKAVMGFLINAGIAKERLQYKGFGESQPIDTNDTESGRKNNRRTEFVII